jgi:hypothetical protein
MGMGDDLAFFLGRSKMAERDLWDEMRWKRPDEEEARWKQGLKINNCDKYDGIGLRREEEGGEDDDK